MRRRPQKRYTHLPIAGINMTPMVDVVLVLLIIFMVAAPLATSAIQLQLPKLSAKSVPRLKSEPFVISLDHQGKMHLNDQPVSQDVLVKQIILARKSHQKEHVFLKADKSLSYEHVVSIINLLKTAGVTNIALVTLMEAGNSEQHDKGKLFH